MCNVPEGRRIVLLPALLEEVVMTSRRLVAIVFALGLVTVGLRAQQQFTLLATILDPQKGTPAETVTSADLHVMEDGADAKVLKVEPVVRTVKVQVLLDNGVGVGQNLTEVRNGLRGLLEALPPDIETTVVTTSPQPRFLVKATKNREELLKGVDRLTLDSGTGRFTESLTEAAERANKEKDVFTIFIAAGTTSGDREIREVHTKRLQEQISGKPMMIHVLMFNGEKSASGGDIQIEVGQAVTKMTGGRYEFINSLSRYATLLPELGAEVKTQATGSAKMFRITVQRPDGKKGSIGKLSISSGALSLINIRME
jgi:hypothetical protein